MSAAAIGAVLCWLVPATSVTLPTLTEVQIVQLATMPATVEQGAWVSFTAGEITGLQWHVRLADLQECPR